jgi:hypothetical protein
MQATSTLTANQRISASEIADRLNARRSGPGWIARCPAHEDRSPSLSIREVDGRTLLHCFAGCTIENICGSLGITVADLFSKPGATSYRPHIVSKAEKQIEDLRSRLTPRERVLLITIVYCDRENLDAGLARALALAVEQELVQVVLEECA